MDPVCTADARERHGFGEWCARRVRQSGWIVSVGWRRSPSTTTAGMLSSSSRRCRSPRRSQSVCWMPGPSLRSWSSYCRDRNTNSVKSMARSVRSFLRFAHATGRTSVGLWGAVPVSAGWHLASLPRSVPAADLERLLAVAARWRLTATDRRDYAILLLLARLGLRRGEVAGLGLDDIDWRAGELTVVGKGDRVERLPLPAEPGEAIAAWLVDGRPECHDAVGVHHPATARSAAIAWSDRPYRRQRMPGRRAGPHRCAPSASHAGDSDAAGRGAAVGGGAGAAPPQREVHRDLRQGR